MRAKKKISLFNFSYLDIMTVLLIVSLILLFSIAGLFSFLPHKDKFLNDLIVYENAFRRLKQDVESKNGVLASVFNSIEVEFRSHRSLIAETSLGLDNLLEISPERISVSERRRMDSLSEEVLIVNARIADLKKQVGLFRSNYVKRRNEWVQEMMVIDTTIDVLINQLPIFYKVDDSGIIDLETGNRIEIKQIIEKHLPLRMVSYPIFIVEQSGFILFEGMLKNLQDLALENNLKMGYEPYNVDLEVIYEVFDIKKP